MRLRLADSGESAGTRTFYNPTTGIGIVVPNPGLSGFFKERKKRRKIKREAKTERLVQRLDNKKIRQGERQQGRIATTRARAVKKVGIQQKKTARHEAKAQQYQQEAQATYDPVYETESDMIPNADVNGGSYMIEPEMYGAEDPMEEIIDTDYEEYEEPGELSAGPLLPMIAGLLPSLLPGVGNLLKKATGTKTGQVTTRVVQQQQQQNRDLVRFKLENESLKNQNASLKTQRYVWGGGALAVGMLTGYMVGRK